MVLRPLEQFYENSHMEVKETEVFHMGNFIEFIINVKKLLYFTFKNYIYVNFLLFMKDDFVLSSVIEYSPFNN